MSAFPPARGDLWGGLAGMLVALPAAIAFGVTVYSAIDPSFAGHGALAGIIGAILIGLVASSLGGTERLISAPCAPATAVLSAFAIEMVRRGDDPSVIVLLLLIVGVLAGLIQVLLGLAGVGQLIKYIPYPVVSGFLSGVGLIIVGSQIPKALGVPDGTTWWHSLASPALWDWRAMAVAIATASVALTAPRWTARVPGTILGIAAGVLMYFALAMHDPRMLVFDANTLIIGPLGAPGVGFVESVAGRWRAIGQMSFGHVVGLLGSAVTLAALMSIDTLKTCVVLDKLAHSRHDSDRELIAQGVANVASSACGGITGAGTIGPTLVALNSGSVSRTAGLLEGLFALLAALMLGSLIAWIPVASLAGILVVIGIRMIDREPLRFLRSRATMLDFIVVASVVIVTVTVGLMAASAVGVGMAMVLFVREQSGGAVVRHKMELGQTSSTWHRPEVEVALLAKKASEAVIFELQGTLFFGNTYRLYFDLEHEIRTRRFVIIDMKRVQSIDVTAAQLFNQIRDAIQERGAKLLLSGVRRNGANGSNLGNLLDHMGLIDPESRTVRIFPDLDSAIAHVEKRLLGESEIAPPVEPPMRLQEMELFAQYKDETLNDLEARMSVRSYAAGETIYSRGSAGDELYWVRSGAVRLVASFGEKGAKQVAGFGRGDFFGGLAFLDNEPRPNDAVAVTPTQVYVLTRENFNEIASLHKKLAFNLASAMARTLAMRLRRTEMKLTALQEY
ncbi:MAG: cyclic nucleotide-binding domain-containing protein [Betaproteobacteria bacterium]|nr:cyclic nucleotide-binding domain-containing protein [Betaproteobacteria bacterium]